MHSMLKSAACVLGALALAVPAAAQQNAPPPQQQGQQAQRPPNAPPPGPPRRPPQPYSPQPAVTASFAGRNANFTGVVDPAAGQLCYLLNVAGIPGVTGAKIVTDKGQPVVNLETPADGSSGTCASIGADVAKALLASPGNYVVQVDNAAYPQGAATAPLSAQTYG
jgi:hypothetical protein